MILQLGALLIAAVILARAAVFIIQKLSVISIKLKISEYIASFVIMAIATSLPELVVGIFAALRGNPTLSLGNIVGSNIANLSIILGISTLIAGALRVQVQVRNREIFFMDLIAIAPLLMLSDGRLTRTEGAVLLLFFAIYIYNLVFQSREYHKVVSDGRTKRPLAIELVLFAIGLVFLLLSAEVMVRTGEALALSLGVPSLLIGIFVVAIATSLPELAVNAQAAIRKQGAVVMGNLLGSTVTNTTLVLGVTALIHPITLERPDLMLTSAIALVVVLIAFTLFVRSEFRISRIEALALILGYVGYIIVTELLYGAGV